MDFGALPPEINSGRMYVGPGSGPMLTAAAAWDRLADDLHNSAAHFNWVISGLTSDGWSGPASVSMAAATAPYKAWMTNTAAQAEQAASQARAAAAAYEAAFATIVPPPVIAANRDHLASLASSSFFGQNAHAIAATEARYAEMWAQDASGMYRYAASSAAASILGSFTAPQLGFLAACTQQQLSALTLVLPRVLQGLAQPWQATSPLTTLSGLGMPASFLTAALCQPAAGRDFACDAVACEVGLSAAAEEPVVSAEIGRANSIGRLSVPRRWTGAAMAQGRLVTMWQGERGSLVSEIHADEPETLATGTEGYGGGDAGSVQWAPPPRYGPPAGWRRV